MVHVHKSILALALLTYLGSPDSLHGEFDPQVKCGFVEGNLLSKTPTSMEVRPTLTHSMISPRGWFKIHYNISGADAISVNDSLADGTPRFSYEAGIAADSAYNVLVNFLGFQPPVADNIDGPQYDIYIKDWHGAYYGMTYFTTTGQPAYLVIDNNFVESSYATHGLEALHVTVVHEFFHMVQVHYSLPSPASYQYWYEMSSVWFEEYCYPEVNDYLAYTKYVFNSNPMPRLDDDSYRMYGQGLYPYVLDKEYGFSGGKHIMADIWEQLGTRNPIVNLKNVLSSARWGNSSLEESLSLYGLYNSFTGARSHLGHSYPDAALLPTVPFSSISITPNIDRIDSYTVPPVSIFYNRYTISGAGILLMTNTTDDQIPTMGQVAVYGQSATFQIFGILQRDLLRSFGTVTSGDTILIPTSNGSSESTNPMMIQIQNEAILYTPKFQQLYPNPIGPNDPNLNLNLIIATAGKTNFTLANLMGQVVDQQSLELYEGIRLIQLKLPARLASGVYILAMETPDNTYFTKFSFIK